MSKSTGFQPPPWVKDPKLPNCGIKVRKGGKIIEEISSLQEQSCVTLGRHKEMADIKLEHPSISRRHAMFGHGSSGNIYVMDLGSTHGTFVNNIRLVKHKREALKNNSIVKFGASTREYIVKLDLDTPDDEEHISTSDTKPSNNNNNNNNTATNGHTNNVNDTSNNSTTNDYNDKNNNNNKNSSKKRPLSDKENDEPSNKKIHLEEVRCRHLLVKHKESRRPRSWRCDDITKTKEEARNEIEKLRNDIITQSEKPQNENENDDDDSNNETNNNNNNNNSKNKKEKFANPLEKAFASFARRLSDCNSARHSGDLGKFKKGKMQKPFENAAFSLNVGQLSEPVETDSGIHLIYRMS